MKIVRFFAFISFLGMYSCAIPVFATDSARFFSGPVFSELCQSGVYPVNSTSWALNRPQIAVTTDGFYFTERKFGENLQWLLNFSADGQTVRYLTAYSSEMRDIAVVGEKIWVLFNDHLDVLDRHSGKLIAQVKTVSQDLSQPLHERAFGMTVAGNKLYVAQGSLGLSVVDIADMSLEKSYMLGLRTQEEGHWSKAVGISQAEGKLYLIIDGVTSQTETSKPLNGVIVTSTTQLDAYESFAIDQRSSGVLTMVMSSQIQKNTLIMNNWGYLQSLPLSSLQNPHQEFKTDFKATRTSFDGKTYNVELMGDMVFSDHHFFACGKFSPDDMVNHIPKRQGLVYQGDL